MEHLYRQAYQSALKARHTLLISHQRPDGDTLGAMLAFANALDAEGKEHTRFCIDRIPRAYRFLPGVERVTADIAQVQKNDPDLIIFFDAGDLRLAGVEELVKSFSRALIINIDHHTKNDHYGHLNIVTDDASSTAEIVHRLLTANNVPIDRDIATCLLTGLCFDTSHFTNPATSALSLAVGAELLQRGGRFNAVLQSLVRNKSVTVLRLWGVALSRLRFNKKYNLASTVITLDDLHVTGNDEEAISGISNFLNGVLNVDTVMVLRELPGGFIRGSLRTAGDRDMSKIARVLGGGGHKKAAGFAIRGRLVEENGEWSVVPA